jgi:hypothetical protein
MAISKLWFRLLGLSLGTAFVAAACGGSGFSAKEDPGDGGGAEGGMAGTSGTSGTGAFAGTGGGTTLCTDASDCDDGKACTLDVCNDVGQCEHPEKCTGDEPACCAGVCGQCCAQADCDDGIDCTSDDCFGGFCTHVPTNCPDHVLQYCSPTGCRDREQCTTPDECDDGDPCTTDVCTDGLCDYPGGCEAGTQCCPGVGCAACCSDSQCNEGSDDLCNPSVCVDGVCQVEPLCQGTGQICCERSGGSADCGVGCCTNDDCDDRPCTRKLCTPTGCRWDPVNDCPVGYVCDPNQAGMCVPTSNCSSNTPCPPPEDPCQQVVCMGGQCIYQNACGNGTTCCPGIGCRECCSSAQCMTGSDTTRTLCCPDGRCGECCSAIDCSSTVARIITGAGPTSGGSDCTSYTCNPSTHLCEAGAITICPSGTICCPPYGCKTPSQCPI